MAEPTRGDLDRTSRARIVDIVATSVLLLVHTCLFALGYFFVAMLVMNTDVCAYQPCGDQAWLWRAILSHKWFGLVLLFGDIGLAVVRLTHRRLGFFVPLVGCILEIGLFATAVGMEAKAGPI
jgi:hypothetical protein